MEITKTCRFLICHVVAVLRCYNKCVKGFNSVAQFMILHSNNFKRFVQFQVVHSQVKDVIADFAALYLGLHYFALVDLNVISVLWLKMVSFELYLIVPLANSLATGTILTVFYLFTSVSTKSDILISKFAQGLVHTCKHAKVSQVKERKRVFVSIFPVRLKYGNYGTFKKNTRMEYFHTLVVDSVSATLAFEKRVGTISISA